ncbi:MAG: serine/threonine protein kinase [Gemmataceae bacterium]|nr:serine/threonine protein kinase [Gemmataceae bacterium]
MVHESLERAAELAVSRYGASPLRVYALVHEVRAALERGESVDLYELFQRDQVLTLPQVNDLRFALDRTQIDLRGDPPKNGSPPAGPAPPPGEESLADLRMLGDYHLLRQLGEGGMGAVFLGYHEQENRQVAVKVLASDSARHQPTLDRFYREAKSGAHLNHPNIVRNLGFGQDQATGLHYLVLEYVDGQSAQQLLEHFGRLTVGDAVHIVLDIARALEHAHSRSIVHRDIKPGNILVAKSGLAKLSDLGLAKRTDETSHLTHTRQGFGTPYYMPFEQAMNAKRADARSDIYALGATLYHLVTGEVPFPGMNALEIMDRKQAGDFVPARTHNAAVPAELDRIIHKMLARDPQDRYQTASELIVDLERADLAADVPSFIDPLDAYSDPLVRERLTTPNQVTQLDLRDGVAAEYWFVLYRDRHGNLCKAKMAGTLLRRRLRSGRLAQDTKVARTPKGPFVAAGAVAELRDGEAEPAAKATKGRPVKATADPMLRWWWMLALTLLVSVLTLLLLIFFNFSARQ